ncbi:MAG: PSP1 domain-containing protein [Planctomycetota bacterium]|jgi:cell fate regulator YaaT (PSP1 superfamily)
MSDQAPTDPAGNGDDHPKPVPPWEKAEQEKDQQAPDLLEALLSGEKTPPPAELPVSLPISEPPADTGESAKSFDELFEDRIRQAVRESESLTEPTESPADDNPLGIYADIDVPPPAPAEPKVEPEIEPEPEAEPAPSEEQPRKSRREKRRRGKGRRQGPEAAVASVPDQEPMDETPAEEELPEEPPDEMAAESMLGGPMAYEPTIRSRSETDEVPVRTEVPSRVAAGDVLTPGQQAKADALAGEIASAGALLAIRYGKMRNIGLFQHKLDIVPAPGVKVTIRSDRGVELGEVARSVCGDTCTKPCLPPQRVAEFAVGNGPDYPLKRQGKVLRVANDQDLADARELAAVCREARRHCRTEARDMGLAMRVVTVEHMLGGERMIFYFTAEYRVDFRELVKRLASKYQTRVELRQVGARDEARLTADFERCGQQCCCQSFLKDLKPVSMRMAKVQKATLDPLKISGRCSRLMCCLRYEDAGYQELRATLPRKNVWVRTETMTGRVVNTHVLTQLVDIALADNTRAVIGVEEILERNVDAPAMPQLQSPRDPRPSPAPRRPAPATVTAAAERADETAGEEEKESGGEQQTSRKRRRHRRGGKGKPSGEATTQSGEAPAASEGAGQKAEGGRKRRRRRRKKR